MLVEMYAPLARLVIAVGSVLFCSACEYDRDTVAAGYYGVMQAGSASSNRPALPGPRSQPQQAVAGMLAQGTAGVAGLAALANTAGVAGSAGSSSIAPAANGCDMSGRWLSTLHTVTDALGNLQYAHSYLYYEIAQQAETFTIIKGLLCGDDAAGTGELSAAVDFSASRAASMSKVSFAGRKGTSVPAAEGCHVELQPWYEVKGATLPYYLDPNMALPTSEQAASGNTPGWEDWDNDGHPGITGTLSGAVTGKIFTAPRRWTSASGDANIKKTFRLAVQWSFESNIMAYDGTPLLASEAARAADSNLHFAQFARLTPDLLPVGDDAQICKRILELAPTLTPEAAAM